MNMKRYIKTVSFFTALLACSYLEAQTTLVNAATVGGFESGTTFAANGWNEAQNGTAAASRWYVGAPGANAGTRGAFVSSDGGTTNSYVTTVARVQHFYRDITFPAGQTNITISFNWKAVAESCCDYVRVHLVPTTTTPAAGTLLTTGFVTGNLNSQSTWQTFSGQLPCTAAGTTMRLVFTFRCDGSLGTQPPPAVDNISVISNVMGSCASTLGTGVVSVPSLPYSSGAVTTCGGVDNITSTNAPVCGSTNYYTGEDNVYEFTPTTSGQVTFNLTSSGSYTGMMLYQGCPNNCFTTPGTCVANEQSSSGSKAFCANVTAGQTYYLIIDSWASPSCNAYSLTISAPTGALAGNVCGTAPSITLPYTATGQTTACYGNDYTNASSGSCGTLYESGEDRVYAYTATGPECLGITLSNASTTSIGFQVYNGCPGTVGTTCIGSAGGSNPLSGSVTLPGAGTYYIVIDTWATPNNANYDISIVSNGSGPVNDLPCSASALALNVNLSGNNMCAGSASEPGVPACWTTGTMHTVWYTVVCPASGQLKIRTTLGTLTNTQIALYSGTCGSLTMVASACNDDAPACGTSSYQNSELTVTGLTPGNTYYIRVDGANDLVGSFDIMAVDGSIGFPPAAGQDCSSPNPVCAQTITIGNPGYQAYGNICDFPGTTICLASGERGNAWYTIPISANGILAFDIVPNDYGNPNPITGQVNPWVSAYDETDYDFALWKIAGSGATNCAGIAAGAVPTRCNYSGLGVTGCFSATTNNAPGAYNPAFNLAYEQQVNVLAGEVYLLAVSNFSNSTSGFSLVFSGTSPINYSGSGTTVTWTGGNNTSWTLPANWGGCNAPVCGINAVIVPASLNQPSLPAGNYYVNNLTINPGASLTLQAGAVLHVCGDFTNNGSLIASPTSTIIFDNAAATQNINGALVGTDKFGNLSVNKTGGSVILNNNIDIGGNFTTSNNTSIFNTTGKYIKVAGNFTNANGNATFTNVTGGTLEFNGTAAQTYNQGASTLALNNVLMNHTGPGVTAATNMVVGTAGVMTLTSGKIITNANEVQITNTASAAITAGNTTSFVQGNLRRFLNGGATSYNFPVGHAVKNYQLANVTFTTATTIPQLLAFFTAWGAVPTGPAASECPTNTYNVLPALDNGYWQIDASANPTSGNYDVTLYSTNYTNSGGASGWTVMKSPSSSFTWGLNGTCVTTSTPPQTSRTGLNGFSRFAVAQSVLPLPIELTSFTGRNEGNYNRLEWMTANETNNDRFDVERSTDGVTFLKIGEVDGAGNSNTLRSYTFNDLHPGAGVNYYRLKQVDFNGTFSHSGIVSIENHFTASVVENVHPNPTGGEVFFDFVTEKSTIIHIVITDMFGRVVVDETRNAEKGRTAVQTKINEAGNGVYTLKIADEENGYSSIIRIVKKQ
jgi:hypothetical protein